MKQARNNSIKKTAAWLCVFMLIGILGPMSANAERFAEERSTETEGAGTASGLIDYFYRCVNANSFQVGNSDVARNITAGGGCKSAADHSFSVLKISLPPDIPSGQAVSNATMKLYATYGVSKTPFALFYMPNQDWDMTTGRDSTMFDTARTTKLLDVFYKADKDYSGIYAGYTAEAAANGDYETSAGAEAMLGTAQSGTMKDYFLGIRGLGSQHEGNYLNVDITDAVNRSIAEGNHSVSLVLSAPGARVSQFTGLSSTVVDVTQKAGFSISWDGNAPVPTAIPTAVPSPTPTAGPEQGGSVTGKEIDYFYRFNGVNAPKPGLTTTTEQIMAGPEDFTVIKITFPKEVSADVTVEEASMHFSRTGSRLPFALFYMPNQKWNVPMDNVQTGLMFNDALNLYQSFCSSAYKEDAVACMQKLYPGYDPQSAYPDESAIKALYQKASDGVLKNEFLGVYGLDADYIQKNYLEIDITSAVNRAIAEGNHSVSLVLSAPVSSRPSFNGLSSSLDPSLRPTFSMTWAGGKEPDNHLTIDKIEFQDENGGSLPDLPPAGGTVRCLVSARNTSAAAKEVTVILAAYEGGEENIRIAEVHSIRLTVPVGGGTLEPTDLAVPAGCSRLRAFVWNDMDTVLPVDGISTAAIPADNHI